MQLGGVGASTIYTRPPRREAVTPRDAEPSECRALITIEASPPAERSAALSRRPLAAFLAHLIATKDDAPQTRVKRRAAPEEVIALYGMRPARPANAGRKVALDA